MTKISDFKPDNRGVQNVLCVLLSVNSKGLMNPKRPVQMYFTDFTHNSLIGPTGMRNYQFNVGQQRLEQNQVFMGQISDYLYLDLAKQIVKAWDLDVSAEEFKALQEEQFRYLGLFCNLTISDLKRYDGLIEGRVESVQLIDLGHWNQEMKELVQKYVGGLGENYLEKYRNYLKKCVPEEMVPSGLLRVLNLNGETWKPPLEIAQKQDVMVGAKRRLSEEMITGEKSSAKNMTAGGAGKSFYTDKDVALCPDENLRNKVFEAESLNDEIIEKEYEVYELSDDDEDDDDGVVEITGTLGELEKQQMSEVIDQVIAMRHEEAGRWKASSNADFKYLNSKRFPNSTSVTVSVRIMEVSSEALAYKVDKDSGIQLGSFKILVCDSAEISETVSHKNSLTLELTTEAQMLEFFGVDELEYLYVQQQALISKAKKQIFRATKPVQLSIFKRPATNHRFSTLTWTSKRIQLTQII